MSHQGSSRKRGAPLALLLVAAVAVVVAIATLRGGSATGSPAGSADPSSGASPAGIGAGGLFGGSPAVGDTAGPRTLPAGLDDRGWIVEIAVQRWLAGSLSGRVLLLPSDEIALTATATSVVSVRYGSGGRTSTVRVRDLAGGRLRASVDRPGRITSAVIAGNTVYVTGDSATGDGADAGVQAISLVDGSVSDLIPPGPAPADATGPVTRSQLRLDSLGGTLGSALCSGDLCTVDVVNLSSGARTTPIRNACGFLLALTSRSVYLVDGASTALTALDAATGDVRWQLNDVQLGAVLPTSDGRRVLISYLPADGSTPFSFTLAVADAGTGALQVLLQRPADTSVPTFYPALSNDRFAVIGSGGTLADQLGGARRAAALSLIDSRSGATQDNAVTLAAP